MNNLSAMVGTSMASVAGYATLGLVGMAIGCGLGIMASIKLYK